MWHIVTPQSLLASLFLRRLDCGLNGLRSGNTYIPNKRRRWTMHCLEEKKGREMKYIYLQNQYFVFNKSIQDHTGEQLQLILFSSFRSITLFIGSIPMSICFLQINGRRSDPSNHLIIIASGKTIGRPNGNQTSCRYYFSFFFFMSCWLALDDGDDTS